MSAEAWPAAPAWARHVEQAESHTGTPCRWYYSDENADAALLLRCDDMTADGAVQGPLELRLWGSNDRAVDLVIDGAEPIRALAAAILRVADELEASR